MATENIIVQSCGNDCPFFFDDSDNGPICYHGVDLSWGMKKEDEIHVKHGIGNCVHSSIPKKCPLLINSFTVQISEIYTKGTAQ